MPAERVMDVPSFSAKVSDLFFFKLTLFGPIENVLIISIALS